MTTATLDRNRQEIENFCKAVAALTDCPDLRKAEEACMQSRTVFAILFPNWRQVRDRNRDSLEQFLNSLRDAHECMAEMEEAEHPESLQHCFESTRCRAEAVTHLLNEDLADVEASEAAVNVLHELVVF